MVFSNSFMHMSFLSKSIGSFGQGLCLNLFWYCATDYYIDKSTKLFYSLLLISHKLRKKLRSPKPIFACKRTIKPGLWEKPKDWSILLKMMDF